MPRTVHAYAAAKKGDAFETFEYDLPDLEPDQVEIKVQHCGICHSDLSMLDNDWGMTKYPFVGGHEVAGKVVAVGDQVLGIKEGQSVGLGWTANSCMHCNQCIGGRHNLCADAAGTIVGRHGGFADRVRCHWAWAFPIPEGVSLAKVGPMFCGGITVFNPLVQHDIPPTARVGVIGIGGLGHMAILFADRWGCEVTAFSTSPDKKDEAHDLGADLFVNVKEDGALKKLAGKFDLIINTANADLDWDAYVATLAPGGVLHTVGAVPGGFGVDQVFPLIMGQRSLSASPTGNPLTIRRMIEFCARHQIEPVTESFRMSQINDAFDKLRNGSPRYRLVLEAD